MERIRSVRALCLLVILVSLAFPTLPVQGAGAPRSDPGLRENRTAPAQAAAVIKVPGDVSTLQGALNIVPDGGVIELADGTYTAPEDGFAVLNAGKGFTVRAAAGATAVLSGQGSRPIMRILNTGFSEKEIIFSGITFRDGYSDREGWAAGITVRQAVVTFIDCVFTGNNGNQPTTGGGALVIADDSIGRIDSCRFENNRARNSGAGLQIYDADAEVINSTFRGNRVNYPGHSPTAAGGAIHIGNSEVSLQNSVFEDNEAGYVGGAVYAIGHWRGDTSLPHTRVMISGSVFRNNRAARDASVSYHSPTEGGAFHAEDQTLAVLTNSDFITNEANIGGGVNLYRAEVTIEGGVFLGNRANGIGQANGFGGAISATSNDGGDASTDGGRINRPPARLTVRNSYIQGNYQGIAAQGQVAAGLYAGGDTFHMYGLAGVPQMGSAADNRARVEVYNTIFNDLDVERTPNVGGSGIGAAIMGDLADITLENSIIMKSDARGDQTLGGGLLIINQSRGTVRNTTFAQNSSTLAGGGLMVQGSEILVDNSRFINNDILPGVDEGQWNSFGSAIYVEGDRSRKISPTGVIQNSVISHNPGIPITDSDSPDAPNRVQYNNNLIYSDSYGGLVYRNDFTTPNIFDLQGFNNLVVPHAAGPFDKVAIENRGSATEPQIGALVAVPPTHDGNSASRSYLAYAYSGGRGALNGEPLPDKAGVISGIAPGEYTLTVGQEAVQLTLPSLVPRLYLPYISQ